MSGKRVLLFATTTGYQTRSFGEVAARLGVELVFATDRCDQIDDPWRDGAIPIRFHDELRSTAAIVEAARATPFDGIVVVGDRPTVIAARAAEALGLPGHPPAAAAVARDKLRTREAFRDAALWVPWFRNYQLSAVGDQPSAESPPIAERRRLTAESFPCVVKPLALSGSRGVIRADDPESLEAAVHRLRTLLAGADIRSERSAAHESILVEGFIPGREYAIEALLHHGVLHVLAIFDKPDPLDGPFFEETIYLTPSAAPPGRQAAIVDAIGRATRALGLHHGPIHAECRVNDEGVYVLEVAARPIGGLCARALRFSRQSPVDSRQSPHDSQQSAGVIPFEEVLLRHALGEDPAGWRREPDASGVMMVPIPRRGMFRGVDGVDAARAVPHVTSVDITAKADQVLLPLPEGASYLGFIFARAEEPEQVDVALRLAHAALRFRIDPELPVLSAPEIRYNPTHG
jgi:hypothetical protein